MKKLVLIAVALLTIGGMTSCKKDHSCSCTIAGVTEVIPVGKTSSSEAKDDCAALSIGGETCTVQ